MSSAPTLKGDFKGPSYDEIVFGQVRRWSSFLRKPRSKDRQIIISVIKSVIPRSYSITWRQYSMGIKPEYMERIVRMLYAQYPNCFKQKKPSVFTFMVTLANMHNVPVGVLM